MRLLQHCYSWGYSIYTIAIICIWSKVRRVGLDDHWTDDVLTARSSPQPLPGEAGRRVLSHQPWWWWQDVLKCTQLALITHLQCLCLSKVWMLCVDDNCRYDGGTALDLCRSTFTSYWVIGGDCVEKRWWWWMWCWRWGGWGGWMDKRLMMASAGQVRTQPTFERATLPGVCVCAKLSICHQPPSFAAPYQ